MKGLSHLLLVTVALAVCGAVAPTVALAQGGRVLRLDEDVERRIESAVAYVSVVYQKRDSTEAYAESGSAFFVNETLLVTNHHVIANALDARAAKVEVRVFSGTNQAQLLPVDIVKADSNLDLALLRIKEPVKGVQPLQVAAELPGKQTEVYAFGFPLGTMLDKSANGPNVSLRRGYVSRLLDDGRFIEADVNIDKGVSGGPMVDSEGDVRGVIRSIAGSNYNQTYAGIAIASPLLLEFCKANGCRLLLKGGQVLEPGTELPPPLTIADDKPQRPRSELGEDVLRAFFGAGSELRLNTLVPRFLVERKSGYDADILRTSQTNIAGLVSHLTKLDAPTELVDECKALAELLGKQQVRPEQLVERADRLEKSCDEWVREASEEQRLNYDLGAWLTELSVGLISADQDLRTCTRFLEAAHKNGVSPEVTQLLERLSEGLKGEKGGSTDERRKALQKDADRLMAIGYLASASGGLNPTTKPGTDTPAPATGERNRINLQIP